jgi:hypothetical protein
MIFVFSGDYAGAVSNNLKLFKYYVLISLTQQLQVSALRISNIQATNKTDRHDIAVILLTVALNTITPNPLSILYVIES